MRLYSFHGYKIVGTIYNYNRSNNHDFKTTNVINDNYDYENKMQKLEVQ